MTSIGQIRHSFPAWRGFVHGMEVSNDMSSCNINWHDGRSPGTAEFVLASELDRYVMTTEDIASVYSDISTADLDPKQIESASTAETVDEAIRENVRRSIADPVKQAVVRSKIAERIRGTNIFQPNITDGFQEAVKNAQAAAQAGFENGSTTPSQFADLRGEFLRFPFQSGQCIFHTGDQVRLFWRDIFDATTWFFGATGFVSDWKESVDANGKRVVTVTVEDVIRLFRLARISTNPAIFDQSVVSSPQFDALIRTWRQDNFTNLTLQELLYIITFGTQNSGEHAQKLLAGATGQLLGVQSLEQFHYGVYGKTTIEDVREHGVGVFNFDDSKIFTFGSPSDTAVAQDFSFSKTLDPLGSMEDWQREVDHIVPTRLEDVLTLAPPSLRTQAASLLGQDSSSTDTELDVNDVITAIGEHPEIFPVDFGRLMILEPSSLGPGTNRDILLKDFVNSIASHTEFATRLQIIYTICERLDFSFYATPRGDVVCEFPQYGLRPEDYGVYADRYRFAIDDTITSESHFEDDKVKTLFISNWNLVKNLVSAGDSQIAWQLPGSAALRALVPQFGLRSEQLAPWGVLDNKDASSYFAYVKLSQHNADAWVENIHTVLRMGIGPNRPCWFEARDFIATIRSVGGAIVWGKGGSVGQTLKLNYRRGWSGQVVQDGRFKGLHVYEPYGGRMAEVIDYSRFFGLDSNKSETSTKPLSGATTSSTPQTSQQAQLQTNVDFMNKQLGTLASALSQATGKNIPPEAITGSFVRTPESNSEAKGIQGSLHLSGLAVDIPQSKLAQYGLTPSQVAESIRFLQNTGDMAPGAVLLERDNIPDDANPNHVHYQITPDDAHRRIAWAPGQAGGQ